MRGAEEWFPYSAEFQTPLKRNNKKFLQNKCFITAEPSTTNRLAVATSKTAKHQVLKIKLTNSSLQYY